MINKLDFAIDKICSRKIYDIDLPDLDHIDFKECKSKEVTKGWIHQYSNTGLDNLKRKTL